MIKSRQINTSGRKHQDEYSSCGTENEEEKCVQETKSQFNQAVYNSDSAVKIE